MVIITAGLFFGSDLAEYAVQISRGERSLGLRAAQDGISSRSDEVLRGYSTFQESPWLGHGILSKFGQTNEGAVGAYNANKDPQFIYLGRCGRGMGICFDYFRGIYNAVDSNIFATASER